MKITTRIIILFCLMILSVISFDAYYTVKQEVLIFYENSVNEAFFLGKIVKDLFENNYQGKNDRDIKDFIKEINEAENNKIINWYDDINKLPDFLSTVKILELKNQKNISFINKDKHKIYAYIPAVLFNDSLAVIEITQEIKGLSFYLNNVLAKIIPMSLILIIFSVFFIILIGNIYIKKPLLILEEKMTNFASGNISNKILLKRKDEFYELENTFNKMIKEIIDYRNQIKEENENKIKIVHQLHHSERLATIGKIASGLAHEIGTPINVLRGRAQIILEEKLNRQEINEYSQIIIEQADLISSIIKQLLNYARSRQSEIKETDINDLISEAINLLLPAIKKKGINTVFKDDIHIPKIKIDRTMFCQAINNIILNAADASGREQTITIETSLVKNNIIRDLGEEQCILIKIIDEGIGIKEEYLKKIFDPFFTTKKNNQGTGLGLSIVKSIIDQLQGSIKVESQINKGTCFFIYLPLIN